VCHEQYKFPARKQRRANARDAAAVVAPLPQQLLAARSHHEERHQARDRHDNGGRHHILSDLLTAAVHAQSLRAGPQAPHEKLVYEHGPAGDARQRAEGWLKDQHGQPQSDWQDGQLSTREQRLIGRTRSRHDAGRTRLTATVKVSWNMMIFLCHFMTLFFHPSLTADTRITAQARPKAMERPRHRNVTNETERKRQRT
jgi:hypothetical protein